MISPSASQPTIQMSSATPGAFGKPLNTSSIYHWKISSDDATLNGSLVNLDLPNLNANKVR